MIRMGRNPSGEEANIKEENTVHTSVAPIRAVSESESMARDIKDGRLSGYVGHGTTLTGETHFQSILRVDGQLTGRVTSDAGTLVVGSTGRINANIAVAAAVINGVINGDIVVTERLEIGKSARVVGNIQSPVLVIEEGALFEGGCTMMKSRESLNKKTVEGVRANGVPEAPGEGVAPRTNTNGIVTA